MYSVPQEGMCSVATKCMLSPHHLLKETNQVARHRGKITMEEPEISCLQKEQKAQCFD